MKEKAPAARIIGLIALMHATAVPALAHGGEPHTPAEAWRTWSWELSVLLGLGLAGWFYARGLHGLWRRPGGRRAVSGRRGGSFAAGLVALFAALVSPIDAVAELLFSVHMVQHLLLMLVAAPLLVAGAHPAVLAWAIPPQLRLDMAGWWHRGGWLRRAWSALTRPAVVWALHTGVLWLWHMPYFYQAALENEFIHLVEHASFLAVAALFWWVVRGYAQRGRRRPAVGQGVFFLFTTMLSNGLLGVLITFSPTLWYPFYSAASRAWGLTPLEDQQLAGTLMWVPAGIVYLGAALLLLGRWLLSMERKEQAVYARHWPRPPLLWLLVLAALLAVPACNQAEGEGRATERAVPGGDAERGAELIRDFGCGSCHTIPDIDGANGEVGPPLTGWARRQLIAGSLPNTPENLMEWIMDPQHFEPGTAMPDLNVTEEEARDMAAYLYTLEGDMK